MGFYCYCIVYKFNLKYINTHNIYLHTNGKTDIAIIGKYPFFFTICVHLHKSNFLKKNLINIAIVAHVDAGKTSITEMMLFHTNIIRKPGSVDQKNTQTDNLDIEKQRGITVSSGIVSFNINNKKINLIDTPGHIDFGAEMEFALLAIDAAIVVISAVEGIQSQTENIIELLVKNKKPFLIFINKIDRTGSDVDTILKELKTELNLYVFKLQNIYNQESNDVEVKDIWNKIDYKKNEKLIEHIISDDNLLLENYLENIFPNFDILNKKFKEQIKNCITIPVFYGSAKFDVGIVELLNGIDKLLPEAQNMESDELSGVVFKVKHDIKNGKLSAVRIFSGQLNSKSLIDNTTEKIKEKANLIFSTDINNPKILQQIDAGDVAWVQGFTQAKPGHLLGKVLNNYKKNLSFPPAFLSVQVLLQNKKDLPILLKALQELNLENPELNFRFYQDENEIHINIRGEIQKEILQQIILERYNIKIDFSAPSVIYKETPGKTAEGFVRYWLPKPCWAIMKFRIEPLPTGSGVIFESIVSFDKIKEKYQNDVRKTIPIALEQGILGWKVDDIKITLIDGEDHEIHTKSNDFSIATPMGIMDGLRNADMQLLEPVLDYKIKIPEIYIGKLSSALHQARAVIKLSENKDGWSILTGSIPIATSINFPIFLNSISSGKAKYKTGLLYYQKCDLPLGKTRKFKGVSPLDTAKYILKARKALQ